MNYYARYFDDEGVFSSADELTDFIASLPSINMTDELAFDIQEFCCEQTTYPRHFRLPNKTTFIVIKTNSQTLEEFKTRGANGGCAVPQNQQKADNISPYDQIVPGRYMVRMQFRRAYVNPLTNKCLYSDDEIQISMLAQSQRQCYDEVVEYLRSREDIDQRSQYPSIRSNNFSATLVDE